IDLVAAAGDVARARRPRAQQGRRAARRHHAGGGRRRPCLLGATRPADVRRDARRAADAGGAVIHVYAVVDGLREIPAVRGVADSALEVAEVHELTVVLSRGEEPTKPSEGELIRHARVVDELMSRSDAVLPARFAAEFASKQALVTALQQRSDELRQALDRVGGCVELGLRVLAGEQTQAAAGDGREY